MLKAFEIETLIKQNTPLPKNHDMLEEFYYYALDICIEMYRQKRISREELMTYRQGYKEIYEQMALWYEILRRHRNIEMILGHAELNIDGCEMCKQVAQILDGRMKIE